MLFFIKPIKKHNYSAYLGILLILILNKNIFLDNIATAYDTEYVANFGAAYEAMLSVSQTDDIVFFPTWYQSYYMQQFPQMQLVACSFFDERKTENTINMDTLITYLQESPQKKGYVSIETSKIYMYTKTYNICEAYMRKICGTSLDTNNVEIYEYNFLASEMPRIHLDITHSYNMDNISVGLHNTKKPVLEIVIAPTPEMEQKKALFANILVESQGTSQSIPVQLLCESSKSESYYYLDLDEYQAIDNIQIQEYMFY